MQVNVRVLETPEEIQTIEALQRLIWRGPESEIVPAHMILATIKNGGLVIGAYVKQEAVLNNKQVDITHRTDHDSFRKLVGFVYGFPGFTPNSEKLEIKHCSHMLGVDPEFRGHGIGYYLKRVQWQLVRNRGIETITWTYDPLLSLNAYLNVHKLGAVCKTYVRNLYGDLNDELNRGLPSDRFQVELWVNSKRVDRRLSRKTRRSLDLAHYFDAGVEIINPSELGDRGWALPGQTPPELEKSISNKEQNLLLVEIPADFVAMKEFDMELSLEWRNHTRMLFEFLFKLDYLVTDFVFLSGANPRSFYVLTHGESTL